MVDQRTADLPEGTDEVIEGANLGSITTEPTDRDQGDDTIAIDDTGNAEDRKGIASKGGVDRSLTATGASDRGLAERFRSGREQLAGQAGDKARGFVTQSLERTSEALANVAKMVGDTAPGIDERLGEEYGGYARRAAGAIENVATAIAEKDPDELIEDTRTFVRNSPGIALAGAAVVGFVVARLLKTGLARDEDAED
jgi:ElaB/YqjD/DUF883 family membrane-anchored ribosome-binding protein